MPNRYQKLVMARYIASQSTPGSNYGWGMQKLNYDLSLILIAVVGTSINCSKLSPSSKEATLESITASDSTVQVPNQNVGLEANDPKVALNLFPEQISMLKSILPDDFALGLNRVLKEYVNLWYPLTAKEITPVNLFSSFAWLAGSTKQLLQEHPLCIAPEGLLEWAQANSQPAYIICRNPIQKIPASCQPSPYCGPNDKACVVGCSKNADPFPLKPSAPSNALSLLDSVQSGMTIDCSTDFAKTNHYCGQVNPKKYDRCFDEPYRDIPSMPGIPPYILLPDQPYKTRWKSVALNENAPFQPLQYAPPTVPCDHLPKYGPIIITPPKTGPVVNGRKLPVNWPNPAQFPIEVTQSPVELANTFKENPTREELESAQNSLKKIKELLSKTLPAVKTTESGSAPDSLSSASDGTNGSGGGENSLDPSNHSLQNNSTGQTSGSATGQISGNETSATSTSGTSGGTNASTSSSSSDGQPWVATNGGSGGNSTPNANSGQQCFAPRCCEQDVNTIGVLPRKVDISYLGSLSSDGKTCSALAPLPSNCNEGICSPSVCGGLDGQTCPSGLICQLPSANSPAESLGSCVESGSQAMSLINPELPCEDVLYPCGAIRYEAMHDANGKCIKVPVSWLTDPCGASSDAK